MNFRYCQFCSHTEKNVEFLCVYKNCDKKERRLCSKCRYEEIHKHNLQNNDHILEIKVFFDRHIKILGKINPLIQTQQEKFLKDLNYWKSEIENAFILLVQKSLSMEDFYKIDALTLNNIIEQFNQGININNLLAKIENCISSFKTFLENLKIQEIFQIQISNYFNIVKNHDINIAQISPDGQFLLHQSNNVEYDVIDIKNRTREKIIESEIVITACTFYNNHLFYGDDIGNVIGYERKDSFVDVFKKRIHFGTIQEIIIIEKNCILTCSADSSIIITNYITNTQVFRQKIKNSIYSISIDCEIKENIIIGCFSDQSIRCFRFDNGQEESSKEYAHKKRIIKIRIDKNDKNDQINKNIITLCEEGSLKIWTLNLKQMHIQIYKRFPELFKGVLIKNFSFISKYLVLISDHVILLLDEYYNQIQKAIHEIKEIDCQNKFQEVNQMNKFHYLVAKGKKQLSLYRIEKIKIRLLSVDFWPS